MSVLTRFLARFLVLVTIYAAVLGVVHLTETDDPLGPGLLLFAAWVVVTGAWSLLDGRRTPFLPAVLTWALVAVALGIALPFGTALVEQSYDARVLGEDVLGTVPFTLALLAVPVLAGVGLGAVLRRSRTDEA